jgi:hypothetical protein
MNVLGRLSFIGAINSKISFLESRLTANQVRARKESTLNRPNSDTEELRREMLLPKSLYES